MKRFSSKKLFWAIILAQSYTVLIFSSLYLTPLLRDFLTQKALLGPFVSGVYIFSGVLALSLILYRYRVTHWQAYLLLSLVVGLFLLQFFNIHLFVERIHLLEYGLFYILWFRVFRHFFSPITVYGATLGFTMSVGFLEELIQHLLPNRHFDWNDIYLNVSGIVLGILGVAILMRYRKDRQPEVS